MIERKTNDGKRVLLHIHIHPLLLNETDGQKDREGCVFAIFGVCDGSEECRALTPICCGSQTQIPGNDY